jgi:hypothetical protein
MKIGQESLENGVVELLSGLVYNMYLRRVGRPRSHGNGAVVGNVGFHDAHVTAEGYGR